MRFREYVYIDMNHSFELSNSARNIVATEEKRLRVMAGPGTGKSTALMWRVKRLLEQDQDPTRILAVTFTRTAAASLVKDLVELGVVGCKKVNAGTLHSYCFSLLNKTNVFEYLNRIPRPILTFSKSGSLQFEGGMMLSDLTITQEFGDKRSCTERVHGFESDWARLQSDQPGWPTDPTDKLFKDRLSAWLNFHRAILLDELVIETLHFLRSNPASDVIGAFDHVIVDEYQDLNRAEQEVIDLLSKRGSLAIVGDRDQSIYSFRYANPEGIDDFKNRHPMTHDESLTECKRCPIRVVEIADQLIRNDYPSSISSRLQASPSNENGKIHIIQWKNSSEEVKGVAKYVIYLVNDEGYAPEDILIITPRSKMAHKIQDIIKKKIPIHSFYYKQALEKPLAQRAFALLTLLNDKEDRVALRWWLGKDSQSGRRCAYQKLREYCEKENRSPRDVLETISQKKLNLPDTDSLLEPFKELNEIIARISMMNMHDLIDDLLPNDNDDYNELREIAERALKSAKNIQELYYHIKNNFIRPEVPSGHIRIMSPQSAKGQTSKVVILTGCNEGLLPFIDPKKPSGHPANNIAEQRRIFYVAITRCTEVLMLSSFIRIDASYARDINIQSVPDGKFYRKTIASRFLSELGPTAPHTRTGSEWQNSNYKTSEA